MNLPFEPEAMSSVCPTCIGAGSASCVWPGENDVDALHPAGKLAIDVEAVVRQQHHHLGALRVAPRQRFSGGCPRGCRTTTAGIIQRGLAIGV